MDNLTHSLVGALIGQAGLKKKTGLAMPALIIGANIPDLDASCYLWLTGSEPLAFRRGITHGPIAWLLLPLALAAILWAFDRWQQKRGKRPEKRLPVHFGWLFALSFIACLTHPSLDWMNTYGIRLLEPFSHQWFYGDTLFIIDIWLWVGMGLAIWMSLRREKRGRNWRKPAQIGILAVLAYIGANNLISHIYADRYRAATGEGPQIIASPIPLYFWQREGFAGGDHRWAMLVQEDRDDAHLHAQDLAGTPCVWPDVETLRQSNASLDAFLFWSRAPFAERAEDGSVLIKDARFAGPLVSRGFTVALPDVQCEPVGEEPAADQPRSDSL